MGFEQGKAQNVFISQIWYLNRLEVGLSRGRKGEEKTIRLFHWSGERLCNLD